MDAQTLIDIVSVSGCTDYYAETEVEAFEMGRDCVAAFNIAPVYKASIQYDEPVYDVNEILGLIPADGSNSFDIYKVRNWEMIYVNTRLPDILDSW